MWETGTKCNCSTCLLFQAENCCYKYIYLRLTGQPALQSNWTLSRWPAQGLMLISGKMRELLQWPCPYPLPCHPPLPPHQSEAVPTPAIIKVCCSVLALPCTSEMLEMFWKYAEVKWYLWARVLHWLLFLYSVESYIQIKWSSSPKSGAMRTTPHPWLSTSSLPAKAMVLFCPQFSWWIAVRSFIERKSLIRVQKSRHILLLGWMFPACPECLFSPAWQ